MTERDLYDAALIEINKLESPSMLLEDYVYYINKAIQQYTNKAYNRYEINQQVTDDLRALKVSTSLDILSAYSETIEDGNIIKIYTTPTFPGESKEYYCELPNDYWHMLSCSISFDKNFKFSNCKEKGSTISTVARKLTAEIAPSIINNAYFKPSYKSPYYAIIATPFQNSLDTIIDPCNLQYSDYGYKINIFCGDDTKYTPKKLYINYLKEPQKIEITEADLDGPDNTKTLEFPEYVCYEIINEFVKLLLENTADPRLSTNIPINQTVIPPITE